MVNWKTFIGLSLFIISGIEFLTIKDHYHINKMDATLLVIEVLFSLTIVMATLLTVQGLRRNSGG